LEDEETIDSDEYLDWMRMTLRVWPDTKLPAWGPEPRRGKLRCDGVVDDQLQFNFQP